MCDLTYIVTDPMTVKVYLKPQLQALVSHNWKVSVICGGDESHLPAPGEIPGVEIHHIPMRRDIDPMKDGVALFQLFALLVRLHPSIVNAGTPKAGLLGMIASRLANIPVRIYQLHGLRLETATGWRRHLLLSTERLACWCSHKVLCVSGSLKDRVLELGVCQSQKLAVLGSGSCTGIQVADYALTPERHAEAIALKKDLGIPSDAPVIGFIGRLTRDKGIVELLEAFALIRDAVCSAHLMLIGPVEQGDSIPEDAVQQITDNPYIRHVNWTDDPRPYLHAMDVFVLPTYREGLPGVLLEAAATETPIVATQATGVVDVVVDGETGLISPVGEAHAIADNVLKLLQNPGLARQLSRAALYKVEHEFSRGDVLHQLESFYQDSLLRSGVWNH